MAKKNHAVNEAQLKARRNSLDKKEHDELINIILRKDSTERKNNAKIQELTTLLKEANELNEENATRIIGFEKDMAGMEEIVKVKQEQIDNLISEKNSCCKKYVLLKERAVLRRTVIFWLFGIIVILCIIIIALMMI